MPCMEEKELYQFVVMGIAMAGRATLFYHGNLYYGKEECCATEGTWIIPSRSCHNTEWSGPHWISIGWDTVMPALGKEP